MVTNQFTKEGPPIGSHRNNYFPSYKVYVFNCSELSAAIDDLLAISIHDSDVSKLNCFSYNAKLIFTTYGAKVL